MRQLILIALLVAQPVLAAELIRGVSPVLHDVAIGERVITADATTPDHIVGMIQQWRVASENHNVFAVWSVPRQPHLYLAFAEGPDTPGAYGPQILVLRVTSSVTKLFESRPMMDADDFDPTFFVTPAATLILADSGNEDVWGIQALKVGEARVRDLGYLPIAAPAKVEFTGSAVPDHVEVRNGRFVVTFACPVVLNPGSEDEQQLGTKGSTVRFVESAKGLRRQ